MPACRWSVSARTASGSRQPVRLDIGLQLRGSIDAVDVHPDGRVRATDFKTGRPKLKARATIDGGATLQPVLYALALEELLPTANVEGGRLYHCTSACDFKSVAVVLDEPAREAAVLLVDTIKAHLERGFFPAAPERDACKYCDYARVCGPHEERRTKRKDANALLPLAALRGRS